MAYDLVFFRFFLAVPVDSKAEVELGTKLKCPHSDCNKVFRNSTLVQYHIKYYHPEDKIDDPLTQPPEKRRSASSMYWFTVVFICNLWNKCLLDLAVGYLVELLTSLLYVNLDLANLMINMCKCTVKLQEDQIAYAHQWMCCHKMLGLCELDK